MRSILFVCTANICRSPTAEGVLRTLLANQGREKGFEIESAGTHDYHVGQPAFPAAVAAAGSRGYDLTQCVARQIAPADFDRRDMILAMDKANLAHLRTVAPTRSKQKIELLTEYSDRYHGLGIPDPYGGKDADYAKALDMIEDACRGLVTLLLR